MGLLVNAGVSINYAMIQRMVHVHKIRSRVGSRSSLGVGWNVAGSVVIVRLHGIELGGRDRFSLDCLSLHRVTDCPEGRILKSLTSMRWPTVGPTKGCRELGRRIIIKSRTSQRNNGTGLQKVKAVRE
jgi:hypothetical protein